VKEHSRLNASMNLSSDLCHQ